MPSFASSPTMPHDEEDPSIPAVPSVKMSPAASKPHVKGEEELDSDGGSLYFLPSRYKIPEKTKDGSPLKSAHNIADMPDEAYPHGNIIPGLPGDGPGKLPRVDAASSSSRTPPTKRGDVRIVTPDKTNVVVLDEVLDNESGSASAYFMPTRLSDSAGIEGPLSVTSDASTLITGVQGYPCRNTLGAPSEAKKYPDTGMVVPSKGRKHREKTKRKSRAETGGGATFPSSRKNDLKPSLKTDHCPPDLESLTAEQGSTDNTILESTGGAKKVRFSVTDEKHRKVKTDRLGESQCCRKTVDEVDGCFQDILMAFDQIFNVFTLEDKDIQAVTGRIEKAKQDHKHWTDETEK